uniref:Putative serine proteinase inhibitor n=1 Tax=Panstrongylus lignarius TaxID=156445 RepID=A0A224XQL8_9HEMI
MAPLTLGALPVVGVLLIFVMSVGINEVKGAEDLTYESNQFSFDLYQALKEPFENLIVSPISADIVIALAYIGAGGNTQTEIAKALHLPDDLEYVRKEYKALLDYLRGPGLYLVTKMFIEQTLFVNPEFQKNVSIYFLSEAGPVSFVAHPERATQEINQWVEQQTVNKIKDLLAKDVRVDSSTRMMLTNAGYFNAKWSSPFDHSRTKDDDFYFDPNHTVTVKMMFQNNRFQFKYDPDLKAKILALPFENKVFNMIVFLPDNITELPGLESRLSRSNFPGILQSLIYTDLIVGLPKFTMNKTTMKLTETLKQLGIKDLFNQTAANLTGIAENLYATAVCQKAFIEVSEEGTVVPFGVAEEVFSKFANSEFTLLY